MSVRAERRGAAFVVTLDRPERRNAVDGPTAAALLEAYEAFVTDDDARVMVLAGGAEAFCAGADLKAIETLRPDLPGGPLGFTRLLSPKPTIAAIRGWAVAGGLELALWCDLRIAAPGARLGCLERRWGVPLVDGGTVRLPRIVGQGRALELVLTGRVVESEEAERIGLVNEIADDPEARALELAETLAGFPQETMLSDRRSLIEGAGMEVEAALDHEARLGMAVLRTGVEGAARFVGGQGRHGV